jgi:hypothetical protein
MMTGKGVRKRRLWPNKNKVQSLCKKKKETVENKPQTENPVPRHEFEPSISQIQI